MSVWSNLGRFLGHVYVVSAGLGFVPGRFVAVVVVLLLLFMVFLLFLLILFLLLVAPPLQASHRWPASCSSAWWPSETRPFTLEDRKFGIIFIHVPSKRWFSLFFSSVFPSKPFRFWGCPGAMARAPILQPSWWHPLLTFLESFKPHYSCAHWNK